LINAQCLGKPIPGKPPSYLAAMGNQKRMLILCNLAQWRDASRHVLADKVDLSQSALSQHLAKLRNARVWSRPAGEAQTIYYSISSNSGNPDVADAQHRIFCK
jgi:DNA-binding transcriptional ArsR family regulator